MPIGIWSTFANHGTVVKAEFSYYNADHHGAAAPDRRGADPQRGKVPASQEVVNAYGNADQGDMTAGLRYTGPAGAYEVGMLEARAFLKAWRKAGKRMSRRSSSAGAGRSSASAGGRQRRAGRRQAVVGLPFLTGSEENRGPLYDITGVPFEGGGCPPARVPRG